MSIRAMAGCLATAVLLLAGCSDDDSGVDDVADAAELILAEDEVPGATGSRLVDELPVLTGCELVARHENRFGSYADDGYAVRELAVETGTGSSTVVVAVFEGIPGPTREQMLFSNLERGLQVCAGDSPLERAGLVESIGPLPGLPDGSFGYTATRTIDDVPEVLERAYAVASDGTVVVVGAHHVGGDQTGIDVPELLAAAVGKVERATTGQDA